jgi:copper chaperone NosL
MLLCAMSAVSCSSGPVEPVAVDTRNDACTHCRMMVSDPRLAGQLIAPQEEPKFFDDIGCLRDYLADAPALAAGSVAFVADYRTGRWQRAAFATYVRRPDLATPMGSHLIAFADAASQAADPRFAGDTALSASDVFGPSGPPHDGITTVVEP